jgi:hypothetical protein
MKWIINGSKGYEMSDKQKTKDNMVVLENEGIEIIVIEMW